MKAKWLLGAFALLAGAGLVGCKDTPEDKKVTFPELQEFNVFAEEHGLLEFNATDDWRLTADKTWFHFVEDDVETAGLMSVSGAKDQGSVYYYISDEAQGDGPSTVEITLAMGGKSQSVYKLTRSGAVRAVKMYTKAAPSDQPTEAAGLDFMYSAARTNSNIILVGFSANFDWKVLSAPEGLDITLPFAGGQDKEPTAEEYRTISIKTAYLPNKIDENLVISDLTGTYKFDIPVSYNGMANGNLFFDPIGFVNNGVEFTDAGIVYNKGKEAPSYEQKLNSEGKWVDDLEKPIMSASANVYAKGMSYKVFVVNENSDGTFTDVTGTSWVTATNVNGVITVKAAANEGYVRSAYVVALPQTYMNAPNFDNADRVYTYKTSKFAAKITQQGQALPVLGDPGFYLKWSKDNAAMNAGNMTQMSSAFYGEFPGLSDISDKLPAKNTWWYGPGVSLLYTTSPDYKGDLIVAPLCGAGYAASKTWYSLSELDGTNWEGVTIESKSDADGEGHPGIVLKGLDTMVEYIHAWNWSSPNENDPDREKIYSYDLNDNPIMRWSKKEKSSGVLFFYNSEESYNSKTDAVAALVFNVQ